MLNQPRYLIERHPLGWLIKSAPGQPGVPLEALQETKSLFGKRSVLHPGIGMVLDAIFVIGQPKDVQRWAERLDEHARQYWAGERGDPSAAWLHSTQVGRSSAALLYALCERWRYTCAKKFRQTPGEFEASPAVPCDAEDFGRCVRLLEWDHDLRPRLPEVATFWSDTAWPKLIAAWGELESLHFQKEYRELTARIQELIKP